MILNKRQLNSKKGGDWGKGGWRRVSARHTVLQEPYEIYNRAQSNNTQRGTVLSSSLKLEPFADLFVLWALHNAHQHCAYVHIYVGARRKDGNISVDFTFFVLLYNSNFMNKIKFNVIFKNWKQKKVIDCANILQSPKSPHFSLGGKVGQHSERKRVPCWSVYCISLALQTFHIRKVFKETPRKLQVPVYNLQSKVLEGVLYNTDFVNNRFGQAPKKLFLNNLIKCVHFFLYLF